MVGGYTEEIIKSSEGQNRPEITWIREKIGGDFWAENGGGGLKNVKKLKKKRQKVQKS